MSRVAIVGDSASDMPPELASGAGVTIVPLLITFGDREYRAGVDLSAEDFWRELTTPGAPFPRTAAAAPGAFRDAFETVLADGADEIVFIGVGSKLSATIGSARVAREMLAERKIHIVDSNTASMATGLLLLLAARRASEGRSADEIVAELERRKGQIRLYWALETLEYLKRGGRISPARAAIGSILSVKPIVTIDDGVVDTADRPRTRSKARERLFEFLSGHNPEMVAILHGQAGDIEKFADELAARIKFPRDEMTIALVGASVGPHVGPGVYGATILPKDRAS